MRLLLLILLLCLPVSVASAQDEPTIPNFFDPQDRLIRPSLSDRARLRFLTVTDFPPFSYIDGRKRLSGFHVELARAICSELELLDVCQIQAVPYGELESTMRDGGGEAIMAGIPVDAASRSRLSFSQPYFRLPARFIARKDAELAEPLVDALTGKTIGVADATAHSAYLQAFFGDSRLRLFATEAEALKALQDGKVEAVFSDALSLSFWLQQPQGQACCNFVGEPYLSEAYFGRGLSIAVKRDDLELAEGLDFALRSINAKGKFAELYLRYFPISLF